MKIHEVELDGAILAQLIRFSEDWTAENRVVKSKMTLKRQRARGIH